MSWFGAGTIALVLALVAGEARAVELIVNSYAFESGDAGVSVPDVDPIFVIDTAGPTLTEATTTLDAPAGVKAVGIVGFASLCGEVYAATGIEDAQAGILSERPWPRRLFRVERTGPAAFTFHDLGELQTSDDPSHGFQPPTALAADPAEDRLLIVGGIGVVFAIDRARLEAHHASDPIELDVAGTYFPSSFGQLEGLAIDPAGGADRFVAAQPHDIIVGMHDWEVTRRRLDGDALAVVGSLTWDPRATTVQPGEDDEETEFPASRFDDLVFASDGALYAVRGPRTADFGRIDLAPGVYVVSPAVPSGSVDAPTDAPGVETAVTDATFGLPRPEALAELPAADATCAPAEDGGALATGGASCQGGSGGLLGVVLFAFAVVRRVRARFARAM